jgi:hypothetical protein
MERTLPPALRREIEERETAQARRVAAHRAWLRRHRWTQAALGALVLAASMAVYFKSISGKLLLDAMLGAAAALAVNALEGGAYRGMLLFGAAGLLDAGLRLWMLGLHPIELIIAVFLVFPSFVIALIYGYAQGLTIDAEHFERRVLPL